MQTLFGFVTQSSPRGGGRLRDEPKERLRRRLQHHQPSLDTKFTIAMVAGWINNIWYLVSALLVSVMCLEPIHCTPPTTRIVLVLFSRGRNLSQRNKGYNAILVKVFFPYPRSQIVSEGYLFHYYMTKSVQSANN